MPIYNYRCPECNKHFERILKVSEIHEVMECPDCKVPSTRALTTFSHYKEIRNNGASVRPKHVSRMGSNK